MRAADSIEAARLGPGTWPHPRHTHRHLLTNARVHHIWWTRNLAAPPPHTAMLTHKRTHGTYMVDQEPGHTPRTYAATHPTNTRMEHIGWTRDRPTGPPSLMAPLTHQRTRGACSVCHEPGRTPDTRHRLLTNARMHQACWTRNLAAPPPHTTAGSLTHAWNTHDGPGTRPAPPPHTHTTAFSQTHAWAIPGGPGISPIHTPRTPPRTNKRTRGACRVGQEPDRTLHTPPPGTRKSTCNN